MRRALQVGLKVVQVRGDDVVVAAHVGADGVGVRRGVQHEQGGGEGFGAVVGEFAREGLSHEAVADVLEVVHTFAKGDGDIRVQRFERVVAAVGDEAATDIGEVADAVVVGEFAEGIEDEDVAVAAGAFAPAAQARGVTGVAHLLGNGVAAFGVARREDEAGVRQGLLDEAVRGEGNFVFAGVGAGGNPGVGRTRGGDVGRQRGFRRGLVFEVGGDGNVGGRHAQLAEAARVLAGLRVHLQVGERFTQQAAGVAVVSTQRFGGEAGVGKDDRDARAGGAADEVRPDFGFHEDERARPDVGEDAAAVGNGVVGQVAVGDALWVARLVLGDLCAAGRGGAGEPEVDGGMGGEETVEQRADGEKFADADGVYPEAVRQGRGEAAGEAFAEVAAVGGVLPRFVEEAEQGKGGEQVQ
mgnify:CR=1 FL=1